MKIVITELFGDSGQFNLLYGTLEVGKNYILYDADNHTAQQRKTAHKLISIWFKSGLWNYDTLDYAEFRDHLKKDYGEGFDRYQYADDNYNIIRVKDIAEIPEYILNDLQDHPLRVKGVLKSFTRYTKKQVMEFIDNLINAMISAGVNSKEFSDLMGGLNSE